MIGGRVWIGVPNRPPGRSVLRRREPGLTQPQLGPVARHSAAQLDTFADQYRPEIDPVLACRRHFQLIPTEQAIAVAGPALGREDGLIVDLAEPEAQVVRAQPAIRQI